jgi:hypothetical protein
MRASAEPVALLVRLLEPVDRARVEGPSRLDAERVLPDERPVLLEREPADDVLLARELVVRRRLEPPLEPDPEPPLLACGIFPP